MSAHTNFQQGQHVWVQLKTGEQFADQFQERRSRHVVLRKRGRVNTDELRAISIARKPHG